MAIITSARTFRAAIISLLAVHALTFVTGCDSSSKAVPHGSLEAHNTPTPAVSDDTLKHTASNALENLPLRFEQASKDGSFLASGAGFGLSIQPTEAVMRMRVAENRANELPPPRRANLSAQKGEQNSPNYGTVTSLRMQLVGANRRARVLGESKLTTRTNYFLGNDASRWSKALPNYARVRVAGIYRDIDVVYYGTGRQVEYDFNVAPGADYRTIRLRFTGAQRMTIDESGDLVLDTAAGQIRQQRPVAYQVIEGSRREIPAHFVITGDREVRFLIHHYDERLPLVIDPVLSYSTYFGGQGTDTVNSVAVDAWGSVYLTGSTFSFDFPLKGGAHGHSRAFTDIFIVKLNASGSELIYSTVVGGSGVESGASIAVDAAGNAWIAGSTSSVDLPTTPGVIQTALAGGRSFDAFVLKLSADGSALGYSTYLGGGDDQSFSADQCYGIAIDSSGNAYVTGRSDSLNFPTTPGALQRTRKSLPDAFVSKLNATGTALLYSTYLGGTSPDEGIGIAVNASGNAFVTGYTSSADFPVTSGAFQTTPGRDSRVSLFFEDAFIAKLNFDGSALIYSTYLGGFRMEIGYAIALDAEDNAFVAGSTQSPNLPATAGSFKPEYEGGFYRSGSAGEGWRLRNSGLAVPALRGLAVDPKTPSNLYLTTNEGLYKSSDSGNSWTKTTSFAFTDLVIDPLNPSTLYGGFGGVNKSTDSGLTWSPVSSGLPSLFFAQKLLIDRLNPSTLYVVGLGFSFVEQEQTSQIDAQIEEPPPTPRFIFKSTDAGQSWQEVRSLPLFQSPPNGFAMDPQEPGRLFVSIGSGTLFRTQNGGDSWRLMNSNALFAPLAVDPRTTGTLYAGSADRLVKSTDDGVTWSAINNGLPAQLDLISIVAIPTTPTTLYAAAGLGLFKSTNAGASWQQSAIEGTPQFIAFNPQNPSTIYTGINDSGDAFVAKLNSSGSALLYCTYLGGRAVDQANDIAIDGSGNAYVSGYTSSDTFATQNALQSAKPRTVPQTAFVTKLSETGGVLLFSTYFGGTKDVSSGQSIALSSSGDVYVAGWTQSIDFPTKNALQSSFKGDLDGFLLKLGAPLITGASISGKQLFVVGENFDQGATLTINGESQNTKNDDASPFTRLIGKKAGKRIPAGQTVRIRVRNSDATLSNELNFLRPIE